MLHWDRFQWSFWCYENYLKNHLISTDISVKLGTVPICIGIGIGIGSVETVLHIITLAIWIGIGIGIGIRQWKHDFNILLNNNWLNNGLKVCSHITKSSPSLIFSLLLFSIVPMNNGQNGWQTHSACYSVSQHWFNAKLNNRLFLN